MNQSVGAVIKALASYWGNEVSDPVKVAQLILRLAESERLPAHLLLGSDAVEYAGQAEVTRAADAQLWREASLSTDFNTGVLYLLCGFERTRPLTIPLTC
jgi:hypothetical protein